MPKAQNVKAEGNAPGFLLEPRSGTTAAVTRSVPMEQRPNQAIARECCTLAHASVAPPDDNPRRPPCIRCNHRVRHSRGPQVLSDGTRDHLLEAVRAAVSLFPVARMAIPKSVCKSHPTTKTTITTLENKTIPSA